MSGDAIPLWVLGAPAGRHGAEERSRFARIVLDLADERARAGLLVTCHRVELFGTAAADAAVAVAPAAAIERAARAAGLEGLRRYQGRAAARYLFRLAAGLESAVTGEDEILHQVRGLLDAVRTVVPADPLLVRALELAIGVGRRARAEQPRPQERSLADRAFDWLAGHQGRIRGGRIVVAGAGVMGRALAVGAARRGAAVTVASRDPERARALATAIGGSWASLDEAAGRVAQADALLVALSGRWDALAERWAGPDGADGPSRDPLPIVDADGVAARPSDWMPLVVDLSSPQAVPEPVRAALGARFIDVDRLFARRPATAARAEAIRRAYVARAEALVEEACALYARWVAARPSVETLRALRASVEAERAQELERLLRRLPDLEPRERALVAAFSEQLVARILHRPTVRLHDDADGTAAQAARLLFDL